MERKNALVAKLSGKKDFISFLTKVESATTSSELDDIIDEISLVIQNSLKPGERGEKFVLLFYLHGLKRIECEKIPQGTSSIKPSDYESLKCIRRGCSQQIRAEGMKLFG